MEPSDPPGCWVVEAGIRQAWPFLTLSDSGARECRLYLDSTRTLDGHTHEATEAAAWLGLVEDLRSPSPVATYQGPRPAEP